MFNGIMWVILALIILLGIVAIFVARKKGKQPKDYFSLFKMGIVFFPVGLFMWLRYDDSAIGLFFTFLGIIYIIMGLSHRKDWKKNHKTWKQLSKKQKRLQTIGFITLGILLIIAIIIYCLVNKGII